MGGIFLFFFGGGCGVRSGNIHCKNLLENSDTKKEKKSIFNHWKVQD